MALRPKLESPADQAPLLSVADAGFGLGLQLAVVAGAPITASPRGLRWRQLQGGLLFRWLSAPDGASWPPKWRGAGLPLPLSPQKSHPVLLLVRESQTANPTTRPSLLAPGTPPQPMNLHRHCGEIARCFFAVAPRELRPASSRVLLAPPLRLGDTIPPWLCSWPSPFPPFMSHVTVPPVSSQTAPPESASLRPRASRPLPPASGVGSTGSLPPPSPAQSPLT